MRYLPHDHGRAFAVEGAKSIGKPTGAGIIFLSVFCVTAVFCIPLKIDLLLYYFFLLLAMFCGFLDDRAATPWTDYKKAILDLFVSLGVAITFSVFQSTEIILPVLGLSFVLSKPLFIVLATALIWLSINVTNCSDGVDGLSSSLTIVALASTLIYSFFFTHRNSEWNRAEILMICILLVYLGFNTFPSSLLMGDAGARPLGVFIAISVLFSGNPLTFFFFCTVICMDGGSGLVKIFLKRFFRISILKKTITPFHDHIRKKIGWTNPQVTARYSILQTWICIVYLSAVYLFQ